MAGGRGRSRRSLLMGLLGGVLGVGVEDEEGLIAVEAQARGGEDEEREV